jgi:hypothetical protein
VVTLDYQFCIVGQLHHRDDRLDTRQTECSGVELPTALILVRRSRGCGCGHVVVAVGCVVVVVGWTWT